MKSGIILSLLLISFLFNISRSTVQGAHTQKQKRAAAWFEGTWKGQEKCKGTSAPVAILLITADASSQFSLSGIYSIQGKIKATLKGDTIFLPRQEVKDPNFMNMLIETGSLVLSAKNHSLIGNITVINNQVKDECVVTYYK